jgi:predicted transcriptional regulator
MAGKNFLLLSLEDTKIKKVSNVISNDSCRKILDYLSNKEATESELATNLQLPISTVHYNLQQLMETGLITSEEFHYSQKGKQVNHYKIANKYIIIAPKKTFGIKEKLKSILPVALIASGAAIVINLVKNYFQRSAVTVTQEAVVAKSMAAEKAVTSAPAMLPQGATEATSKAVYLLPQNIALWFFIGALFTLVVYFILNQENT